MKRLLITAGLLAALAHPAGAHRLDEYLQATIFSIEPGQVTATMRLVPGVAVAARILACIDTNHDGVLSPDEQQAYARQVLRDLRLNEDNNPHALHPQTITFPTVEQIKAGTGELELSFTANLVSHNGAHRLTFEDRHQSSLSVYLVNSLVPQSSTVQLGTQTRNQNQSFYQIDFTQSAQGESPTAPGLSWSGFGAAYRLGVHHIAEGTDHLLFLLALLLPSPLLAVAGRWCRRATLPQSLRHMLGIVTAFTLGHSLTLALAGFGIVHPPGGVVEVLIAVSILVSAVHAIRPLVAGREAWIAASFGLVHGLAFASSLSELGLTGWYRLISLLGFNLGIEAMQLAVVAVTLPAMILLSRTLIYPAFRVGGALVAIAAASAWIVERTIKKPNAVVDLVEGCGRHGLLLAACLWGLCALTWYFEQHRSYAAQASA